MADWMCHERREDGEWWPEPEFDTREQAVEAGMARYGRDFEVGRAERYVAAADADRFLGALADDAWEFGEFAEGWCNDLTYSEEAVEELQGELQGVLDAWLSRHNLEPRFFIVRDIEQVEAPC